jgi:hypothetical protein
MVPVMKASLEQNKTLNAEEHKTFFGFHGKYSQKGQEIGTYAAIILMFSPLVIYILPNNILHFLYKHELACQIYGWGSFFGSWFITTPISKFYVNLKLKNHCEKFGHYVKKRQL